MYVVHLHTYTHFTPACMHAHVYTHTHTGKIYKHKKMNTFLKIIFRLCIKSTQNINEFSVQTWVPFTPYQHVLNTILAILGIFDNPS